MMKYNVCPSHAPSLKISHFEFGQTSGAEASQCDTNVNMHQFGAPFWRSGCLVCHKSPLNFYVTDRCCACFVWTRNDWIGKVFTRKCSKIPQLISRITAVDMPTTTYYFFQIFPNFFFFKKHCSLYIYIWSVTDIFD